MSVLKCGLFERELSLTRRGLGKASLGKFTNH
jgi:hypothetical protein